MNIVPVMSLYKGACVTSGEGDAGLTEVSNDPEDLAGRWMDRGAEALLIFDREGEDAGSSIHKSIIKHIALRFPNFPVKVFGGFTETAEIEEYLSAGAAEVIVTVNSVSDAECLAKLSRAHEGRVSACWRLDRNVEGRLACLSKLAGSGLKSIVALDRSVESSCKGVNVDATIALAEQTDIPVWAWGGVADMDDIRALYAESDVGIEGVYTGRALAEKTLDLKEAERYCEE